MPAARPLRQRYAIAAVSITVAVFGLAPASEASTRSAGTHGVAAEKQFEIINDGYRLIHEVDDVNGHPWDYTQHVTWHLVWKSSASRAANWGGDSWLKITDSATGSGVPGGPCRSDHTYTPASSAGLYAGPSPPTLEPAGGHDSRIAWINAPNAGPCTYIDGMQWRAVDGKKWTPADGNPVFRFEQIVNLARVTHNGDAWTYLRTASGIFPAPAPGKVTIVDKERLQIRTVSG